MLLIRNFNKSHTNTNSKCHTLYYCEHCKISGHSIERCFKLNGYPSGFKHKKFAGSVNGKAPKIDKSDIALTTEQLQNLLNFLNNQKENVPVTMPLDFEEPSNFVNLTGKFCFLSKSITTKWIAYGGATDHMCNSLDSFIFTQKIHNLKHNITILDGIKVVVDLYGDIVLMEGLVLKDVLYVPTYQSNLIMCINCALIFALMLFLLMVSASFRTI